MPYYRHVKGKYGEDTACRYLEQQGFKLLLQNFRCHYGEIDLIMQDKEDIVFVEVRSRGRTDFGNALESVTPAKINKILRTAKYFLQLNEWTYTVPSRFDIVAIHPVEGEVTLEWFKNAFIAKRW